MLGWINDCVEKLVISKFGLDAWHAIKQKAGCKVPDGGFYKLDVYSDKSTVDLVVAATEVSGLSTEVVLETFGAFFVEYVKDEGYENLLLCQGSNLKDFMANINAMHQHLQDTFPKKMIMPQFWVEDDESGDGSLLLHYHSKRGNLLAPVAKGVVVEIASTQFGYEINMERLRTQGEEGADFTSWRITTVDPQAMWKLGMQEEGKDKMKTTQQSVKCPFTGMTFQVPSDGPMPPHAVSGASKKRKREDETQSPTHAQVHSSNAIEDETKEVEISDLESNDSSPIEISNRTGVTQAAPTVSASESLSSSGGGAGIGLSATVTKSLFPYHVMVSSDFKIAQVGNKLPDILKTQETDLIGRALEDVFVLTKPGGVKWNWKWLQLLEGQAFEVEPKHTRTPFSFKTTVVHMDTPCMAMLVMTPEAHSLEELREMELTFSDLPIHGGHRDSIFLREHLSSQMNSALRMEKLSRSLEMEKTLLESMLPSHAAEGLRRGETVEPRLHDNCTMYFSDIVGFTKICKKLYPWQVIEMLNRLYCVFDYLAKKFNLYKIETIGDAYVCASGLPLPDSDHAKNVANFAIAVSHCSRHVLSPVDGSPIQLRIGLHTGACASGIVGSTNPRYCVFGDTVNTTARHESSGVPGKIHCSSSTQAELELRCNGSFTLQKRGLVEMKGKGLLTTWWLEGHESNPLVNSSALATLDEEIKELLSKTNFKTSFPESEGSITAEIQNRRLGQLGKNETQIQASLKPKTSNGSIHAIGVLRKRFKTEERNSTKASGPLNIDWGNRSRAPPRCGNSLLDAVDRCKDATSKTESALSSSSVGKAPPSY